MGLSLPKSGAHPIESVVELGRYPIDELGSANAGALIARCREELAGSGSFSLEGFLQPAALTECVAQIMPRMAAVAHRHSQTHNVYFRDDVADVPGAHGALVPLTSANYTLTCDQLEGTVIRTVYEWDALLRFFAAVFDQPRMYRMDDPLARLNVMGYGTGDALNWHFDRAQFTVTLLLQAPEAGGVFEYRPALRGETDPNYAGVARLLAGEDPRVRSLRLEPGTLNVFAGRFAAHRITAVEGKRMRLVAILSYVGSPGVEFTPEDRVRFYGRSH